MKLPWNSKERTFEQSMARSNVESFEKWREWCNKIPSFHFDSDWEVKIIPPFCGALARFTVKKGTKIVSVYFDAYNALGCVTDNDDNPIPYFEVYDFNNESPNRYYMDETENMINDIRNILNS